MLRPSRAVVLMVQGRWRRISASMSAFWADDSGLSEHPLMVKSIAPISREDVKVLINTGERGLLSGKGGRAVFHFVLDTGG